MPGFLFELRHEDGFEEEVAEFFAHALVVVPVDGFEQLVGFLEDVFLQRVDGLLAVPGTPVRGAQCSHDLDEPDELARGVGSERLW